jgi:hypothetical protein
VPCPKVSKNKLHIVKIKGTRIKKGILKFKFFIYSP